LRLSEQRRELIRGGLISSYIRLTEAVSLDNEDVVFGKTNSLRLASLKIRH
jgi:hypothetical protein